MSGTLIHMKCTKIYIVPLVLGGLLRLSRMCIDRPLIQILDEASMVGATLIIHSEHEILIQRLNSESFFHKF